MLSTLNKIYINIQNYKGWGAKIRLRPVETKLLTKKTSQRHRTIPISIKRIQHFGFQVLGTYHSFTITLRTEVNNEVM